MAKKKSKTPKIETLLTWVYDAFLAHREWKAEAWRMHEFRDGKHWSDTELAEMDDKQLIALTINRIHPILNLLAGAQAINRQDIIGKARTKKDVSLGQLITEGIKFIFDQWDGDGLVAQAYLSSITGGWDGISQGINGNPNKERIMLHEADWKNVWWDPFGSAWLEPHKTRHMFIAKWTDVDQLKELFDDKAKEIEDEVREIFDTPHRHITPLWDDEATLVEEKRLKVISSDWGNLATQRRRCRPVEMWYTNIEKVWYGVFPDGRAIDLDKLPPQEMAEALRYVPKIVRAPIRKIRTVTFLGKTILQDMESPYPHDEYPVVPFVGYLDRYGFPFGVPQQIVEQNMEVNKRRSMALASINNRRVIVESGAAKNLQEVYEEANKMDGMIVLNRNKMDRFKIQEMAQLTEPQIAMMLQSEREIQEISGVNAEQSGYGSNVTSGIALEKRQNQAATTTATLQDNQRRSLKRMGDVLVPTMQSEWRGPKVLRITDSITSAERFMMINEPVQIGPDQYEIRNDITQAKFDTVVTTAPQTDTIRERNMDLVIKVVEKSPQEMVPHLLALFFEMADLPNKDQLMSKMKPILGIDPAEEDMTLDQLKERSLQMAAANQQKAKEAENFDKFLREKTMEKAFLENEELKAKIGEIIGKTDDNSVKAKAIQDKVALEVTKAGFEMQQQLQYPPQQPKQIEDGAGITVR